LGVAEFRGLKPDTYPVDITADNYLDNREGASGGLGIADTDISNDTFVVGNYSDKPFQLKNTSVNVSITVTYREPAAKGGV